MQITCPRNHRLHLPSLLKLRRNWKPIQMKIIKCKNKTKKLTIIRIAEAIDHLKMLSMNGRHATKYLFIRQRVAECINSDWHVAWIKRTVIKISVVFRNLFKGESIKLKLVDEFKIKKNYKPDQHHEIWNTSSRSPWSPHCNRCSLKALY